MVETPKKKVIHKHKTAEVLLIENRNLVEMNEKLKALIRDIIASLEKTL